MLGHATRIFSRIEHGRLRGRALRVFNGSATVHRVIRLQPEPHCRSLLPRLFIAGILQLARDGRKGIRILAVGINAEQFEVYPMIVRRMLQRIFQYFLRLRIAAKIQEQVCLVNRIDIVCLLAFFNLGRCRRAGKVPGFRR